MIIIYITQIKINFYKSKNMYITFKNNSQIMNKYLVIGSNSFSGSNFINYILSKKNIKIIGTSRSKINKVYLPYKNNKYQKLFIL